MSIGTNGENVLLIRFFLSLFPNNKNGNQTDYRRSAKYAGNCFMAKYGQQCRQTQADKTEDETENLPSSTLAKLLTNCMVFQLYPMA